MPWDGQEKDTTGHGITVGQGEGFLRARQQKTELRETKKERERERKREDDASAVMPSQGERSVHSLSDQKLKATLNEMNAFTCLLHLPRHIHSPFHFKCSAALLWVAALSSRPSRCTHRSFWPPSPLYAPSSVPLARRACHGRSRIIYRIRENFVDTDRVRLLLSGCLGFSHDLEARSTATR